MKKNFLITTGGSGGHVIPATIFYDHLSKNANLIISTDNRGLRYLDVNGYKFAIINTPRINNILFLPFNFFFNFISYFKIYFFIKK